MESTTVSSSTRDDAGKDEKTNASGDSDDDSMHIDSPDLRLRPADRADCDFGRRHTGRDAPASGATTPRGAVIDATRTLRSGQKWNRDDEISSVDEESKKSKMSKMSALSKTKTTTKHEELDPTKASAVRTTTKKTGTMKTTSTYGSTTRAPSLPGLGISEHKSAISGAPKTAVTVNAAGTAKAQSTARDGKATAKPSATVVGPEKKSVFKVADMGDKTKAPTITETVLTAGQPADTMKTGASATAVVATGTTAVTTGQMKTAATARDEGSIALAPTARGATTTDRDGSKTVRDGTTTARGASKASRGGAAQSQQPRSVMVGGGRKSGVSASALPTTSRHE